MAEMNLALVNMAAARRATTLLLAASHSAEGLRVWHAHCEAALSEGLCPICGAALLPGRLCPGCAAMWAPGMAVLRIGGSETPPTAYQDWAPAGPLPSTA